MLNPHLDDGDIRVYLADCLDAMRELPADSVDAVCTDPPYSLAFMGREWDSHDSPHAFQSWCEAWAREALRIAKPGAHLAAFGGPRTFHRLTAGIEDAGWEIRDCLAWMYGSGFPKSLDVSKAIDKRRDDHDARCAVAEWLRPHIERAGFDTVTRAFGFKDETMARARWTTRSQPQTPTWEQWERLRELCGFGDEMDAEVWRLNGRKGTPGDAWHDRPIIGRGSAGIVPDPARGERHTVGGHTREFDITAPATAAAAEWAGWGTALKPAYEPIILARKPLRGTVAANVLAHGTGALNIDATRIEAGSDYTELEVTQGGKAGGGYDVGSSDGTRRTTFKPAAGRWPANVVLDPEAAKLLDEQTGDLPAGVAVNRNKRGGMAAGATSAATAAGGFAHRQEAGSDVTYGDSGGASRFFYTAKADAEERVAPDGTRIGHPTLKPTDLMRWLVRLVTPPGGLVLDPFAGSGSTGVACRAEGFRCVLIEREDEYAAYIRARLSQPTLFTEECRNG